MSCAKNNNIQITDEFGNVINPVTYNRRKRATLNCRRYKSVYPSFTPTINSLFVRSSLAGEYSNVMINGSNFLPPSYGVTYVNFGPFKNLPITFYSTTAISFVVPLNALPGTYIVQVVNIYNGNFSPTVNQSYPGIPNFSNSFTYSISSFSYSLTGTYSITSNSSYNTIITFTNNGSFTILNTYSSSIPINYIVVGGGGGGGGGNIGASPGAGGGGGGGVSTGLFNSSVTNYNITVGAGGLGGNLETASPSTDGANGSSSQISGVAITVTGGLGGKASSNLGAGGNSGNGGVGGTGNTAPGGNGINGGGGGGSSYLGVSVGGNGSISSTSVYLYGTSFGAGGGGGGGNDPGGTSGNIYAGNGGTVGLANGLPATANYGGGGGGGKSGNGVPGTYGNGGNGGSGIVILYFNN
jgi:hypothetical protein